MFSLCFNNDVSSTVKVYRGTSPGVGNIQQKQYSCQGYESSLDECTVYNHTNSCTHDLDVYVTCQSEYVNIQLHLYVWNVYMNRCQSATGNKC